MTLQECIRNGGASWVKLITAALGAIPADAIDARVRTEIINCDTYTGRLWFLVVMLYVLKIDIHLDNDPYAHYMLLHGYTYINATFFIVGDVFKYMYTLETRMQEYHDMVRPVAGRADDGNAHH